MGEGREGRMGKEGGEGKREGRRVEGLEEGEGKGWLERVGERRQLLTAEPVHGDFALSFVSLFLPPSGFKDTSR